MRSLEGSLIARPFLFIAFLAPVVFSTTSTSAQAPVAVHNGDTNGDGSLDISDAIYLLVHLFRSGPPPVAIADTEARRNLSAIEGALTTSCETGKTAELASAVSGILGVERDGCTDPGALNYDPCATVDDGSCLAVPDGFTFLRVNPQSGLREYLHDLTRIEFVFLPGTGEEGFLMGRPDDERCFAPNDNDERPVHRVVLSPFLIAKHEVPLWVWNRITLGNWLRDFGVGNLPQSLRQNWHDLPAAYVRQDVILEDFLNRTDLRLPTEAQWEYAARGGTDTPYAVGDGHCLGTDEMNYLGDAPCPGCPASESRHHPVPVDSFEPNGFGLFNMHGNVWEWCEDVYDPDFYSFPEAAGPDPVSTSGSEARVLRGGGFNSLGSHCRSANRASGELVGDPFAIGFRPAYWPLR